MERGGVRILRRVEGRWFLFLDTPETAARVPKRHSKEKRETNREREREKERERDGER